jgi:hypothetical protein
MMMMMRPQNSVGGENGSWQLDTEIQSTLFVVWVCVQLSINFELSNKVSATPSSLFGASSRQTVLCLAVTSY